MLASVAMSSSSEERLESCCSAIGGKGLKKTGCSLEGPGRGDGG